MQRYRTQRRMFCTLLMSILFLSAMLAPLSAQQDSYQFYQPRDTVFRLVGTNLGDLTIAQDELLLDYSREYNKIHPDVFRNMLANPLDTFERKKRAFYLAALAAGYKIIAPVEEVGPELKFTRAMENYARADSVYFHNLPFYKVHPWSTFDSVMYGIAQGVVVPEDIVRNDTLVVSAPAYNATYAFHRGNPSLYATAGLPDRSTHLRISFTIKADSLDRLVNPVPDGALLGYGVLYCRTRKNQDSCRCMVYEPFDTINVTKLHYLDSALATDSATGYREFGKTIDFARGYRVALYDSLVITRNSADSTLSEQRFEFYNRDTVAGRLISTQVVRDTTVPDNTQSPPGTRKIYVRRDSIELHHVPLHDLPPDPWLVGDGWSWFGYGTCSETDCSTRVANGEFGPGAIQEYTDVSDFNFRFYSTRRVPVTFLRLRINQDMYDQLRAGALDTMMSQGVQRLFANDTLNQLIGRLSYSDETTFHKYRADGAVARKLQDLLRKEGDSVRQLWCNPVSNFAAFRVLSEDLDTSRVKTLQLMVRQDYVQIGGPTEGDPIPIFYVNPDSMSQFATDSIYQPYFINNAGVQERYRMICSHNDTAYRFYDSIRQNRFGNFMDSKTIAGRGQGPTVTTVARLVDVAKFRYQQFGPPTLVWNTIQDMGWRITTNTPAIDGLGRAYNHWSSRPPTAEEITAQAWLSLNCGVDGLVYTDMQYDAANFGFIHPLAGKLEKEYDSLLPANTSILDTTAADTLRWKQPLMWTGFKSRYEAVKRMNQEIRHLDSLIHLSQLVFRQEQMSAHDERQTFATMPMLDTVMTERAKRYDRGIGGAFIGSDTIDARENTYLEITHFLPGSRDTLRDSRYFLFTNRRCWPVDTISYGATAQSYGAHATGLGAIDVRRPIVVIKSTQGMMSDSVLIEKVGHEGDWSSRLVAIGDTVELDWLKPGWGAYYRFTVVPVPVSQFGTAYNNAIHGENPSTDSVMKDRIVVYERDSAIYLRTMDPAGRWSHEWLISDPADTQRVENVRVADNLHPAFATVRNGGSCMVVWERRNAGEDSASVEFCYIDSLPSKAGGLTTDTLLRRLASPRWLMHSWMNLTPAIVGMEDGYLISWASPNDGVEVVALRDEPLIYAGIYPTDTSTTMRAKMRRLVLGGIWPPDSIGLFPTLAYSPNGGPVRINGGRLSYEMEEEHKDYTRELLGTDTLEWLRTAHLAYQQGERTNSNWEIMYNTVGVDFHSDHNLPPRIWLSETEHVSENIPGCEFKHPSIAVDSMNVGVAFETLWATLSVTLRHRDTSRIVPPRNRWNTPYYKWGGNDPIGRRAILPKFRKYERPALIHFPALRMEHLQNAMEGGITWHWTNAPNNRRNRQLIYRYGDVAADTLPDGKHPSFLLTPYIGQTNDAVFSATSVFYRGSDTLRFERELTGVTATYYPGFLENTPREPRDLFTRPFAQQNAILGSYTMSKVETNHSRCNPTRTDLDIGILRKTDPPRRRDPFMVSPSNPPFPPPYFPETPVRVMTHPLMGWNTPTRTGVFTSTDTSVTIRLIISGSDSLISWLNTQPPVIVPGGPTIPANIIISTQLVRVSDSVVIWEGDTISARTIGPDLVDEDVEVPVDSVASPGTDVFIRVMAVPTDSLEFTFTGGFHFLEDLEEVAVKRVNRRETKEGNEKETSIAIGLVPNPLRSGTGTLEMRFMKAGKVTVTVADLLGRIVLVLPPFEVSRPGEYTMPVDLTGLRNGMYVVQAEQGRDRGATRITLMR